MIEREVNESATSGDAPVPFDRMAHYKNATVMDRLRQHHQQFGLVLIFDAQGRIEPTNGTCADIIRAFLDHRLMSPFSQNIYDVPDTTMVQ